MDLSGQGITNGSQMIRSGKNLMWTGVSEWSNEIAIIHASLCGRWEMSQVLDIIFAVQQKLFVNWMIQDLYIMRETLRQKCRMFTLRCTQD